jgi:hypothetical protein
MDIKAPPAVRAAIEANYAGPTSMETPAFGTLVPPSRTARASAALRSLRPGATRPMTPLLASALPAAEPGKGSASRSSRRPSGPRPRPTPEELPRAPVRVAPLSAGLPSANMDVSPLTTRAERRGRKATPDTSELPAAQAPAVGAPVTASPAAPLPLPATLGALLASPAHRRLLLGALMALVLALTSLGVLLLWTPSTGVVLVEVPRELEGVAQVRIDERDLGVPSSWPVVERVRLGSSTVVVSVAGQAPHTETITLKVKDEVARVRAPLRPPTAAQAR